jgi:hypothetical protein
MYLLIKQDPEFPELLPRKDVEWNYELVISSNKIACLSNSGVSVKQLSAAVASYLRPKVLKHLNWHSVNVFGTENFFCTIDTKTHKEMNEFMPVAGMAILFKESKEVLLLSDYESDQILKIFWTSAPVRVCLINFADLRNHLDGYSSQPLFGLSKHGVNFYDYEKEVAAIQLFNGETTFGAENELNQNARQRYVKQFLGPKRKDTRGAVMELVHSRELGSNYSCSDLEKISFQH